MATLTINYIANFAGNHRICYRQVGTTDYCCVIDVVGATGPQTVVIDFSVPADYCDGTPEEVVVPVETECGPFSYEGYIQPICEPEGSLLSRTAFGPITYTQDVACQSYDVACETVDVASITLTNGGQGYTNIPLVTISAVAPGCSSLPSVSIDTLEVFSAQGEFNGGLGTGTDYTVGDVLALVGGTGTPAEVTVATLNGSAVLTVTLTNPGSYTVLPGSNNIATTCVTCANPLATGALIDANYTITAINVLSLGTGCGTAPTVSLVGGSPETPGSIFVEMSPCPAITTPACGTPAGSTVELALGDTVTFCDTTLPVLPDYTVTSAGPCCGCTKATLNLIGDPLDVVDYVYYTDKATGDVIYLDNAGLGFAPATAPGTLVFTDIEIIPGSVGIAPTLNVTVNITTAAC